MRANDTRGVPRAGVFLAAVALVCCVPTACTGPARTTATYQSKAADTAEEVVSASRTVLLAAQIGDAGRSFPQTIAVTIANAETDAETARDAFSSIQPPDATSDDIRATLLPSVEQACNIIADVRIVARRADVGTLSQIAAPLEKIADDLEGFSERYG
jgi:hypothetical protein